MSFENPWDKTIPKYKVDIVPDINIVEGGLIITQVAVFGFDNERNRHDQITEVLDLLSPFRLAEHIRVMRPDELKDFRKTADNDTSLISRKDMPAVHVLRRDYFEKIKSR